MILIMMDSALLFKRNFEKKLLKDKKKKPISLPLMIYHVQLLTMQFFFFGGNPHRNCHYAALC